MSCNISRFYYCEPSITVSEFVLREHRRRQGIIFEDIPTPEADEFEKKLIEEKEQYLRVDL